MDRCHAGSLQPHCVSNNAPLELNASVSLGVAQEQPHNRAMALSNELNPELAKQHVDLEGRLRQQIVELEARLSKLQVDMDDRLRSLDVELVALRECSTTRDTNTGNRMLTTLVEFVTQSKRPLVAEEADARNLSDSYGPIMHKLAGHDQQLASLRVELHRILELLGVPAPIPAAHKMQGAVMAALTTEDGSQMTRPVTEGGGLIPRVVTGVMTTKAPDSGEELRNKLKANAEILGGQGPTCLEGDLSNSQKPTSRAVDLEFDPSGNFNLSKQSEQSASELLSNIQKSSGAAIEEALCSSKPIGTQTDEVAQWRHATTSDLTDLADDDYVCRLEESIWDAVLFVGLPVLSHHESIAVLICNAAKIGCRLYPW